MSEDQRHSHGPLPGETPVAVIACVSRVVSRVIDRLTGDRVDYPLMVAAATAEALKLFGIESRVMYGKAAWIEVMEDHSVQWAGCWGENFYFWTATQYGEVVDLNASVQCRKQGHTAGSLKGQYSPPMLWSAEVPKFYRYAPEGVAELELHDEKEQKKYDLVLEEIREKCTPEMIAGKEPEFLNEPILCPGRKLLDDANDTFKHFDRDLAVSGILSVPFEMF